MTMVINDLPIEKLARQIATAGGLTVVDVVHDGLLPRAGPSKTADKRAALEARLTALAREIEALPKRPNQGRSENAMLGYDQRGAG